MIFLNRKNLKLINFLILILICERNFFLNENNIFIIFIFYTNLIFI